MVNEKKSADEEKEDLYGGVGRAAGKRKEEGGGAVYIMQYSLTVKDDHKASSS